MANTKNLKKGNPSTQFTSGRLAVENGRKGGKAKAKKIKEQKKFKELCEDLLSQKLTQKDLIEHFKKYGIETKEVSNKMAMVISMWESALSGNTKAFEIIQDLIGEKPQKTLNLNLNKKLEDLIK